MAVDPQMRWLRLWTDVLEDAKLLLLAPGDRWYYIAVLALKRSGLLDERDAPEMRDRKVALKLRLDAPERDELKRRLMEVRLIDKDWQPLGWGKRQFDSDTSAARTRKYRAKKRSGDAGVTSQERHRDALRAETEQRQSRAEHTQSVTPSHEPSPPDPDPSPGVTTAGAVCVTTRSLGMLDGNPSHPKLLALIEAGATIGEFEGAAKAAIAKGKGFAYTLAIVENQRREAVRIASMPAVPEPERRWEPPDEEPERAQG